MTNKEAIEFLSEYEKKIINNTKFIFPDMIYFGKYEWYVIDHSQATCTLLCKDIIGYRAYNDEETYITWEECTLRKYLNNDFYNSFSEEDKAMIQEVTNRNPDNSEYNTKGGNDTKDKIYLLSIDEAEVLSIDIRKCSDWWWLRSPGLDSYSAAGVSSDGDFGADSDFVLCECGVRPTLKLKF